jgi:hypothetical protein
MDLTKQPRLGCEYSKKDYRNVVGQHEDSDDETVDLPSKDALYECFSKMPDDCSQEEIEGVRFFYHHALAVVDKRIKHTRLMLRSDVWKVLGDRWSTDMAYAMVLVERHSDLANIIQNEKLRTPSPHDQQEPAKRSKKKINTKNEQETRARLLFDHREYFAGIKMNKDKDKRMAARARFVAWEKKVGIIPVGDRPTANANKRVAEHPMQMENKKQKVEQDNQMMSELKQMDFRTDMNWETFSDDDEEFLVRQSVQI